MPFQQDMSFSLDGWPHLVVVTYGMVCSLKNYGGSESTFPVYSHVRSKVVFTAR